MSRIFRATALRGRSEEFSISTPLPVDAYGYHVPLLFPNFWTFTVEGDVESPGSTIDQTRFATLPRRNANIGSSYFQTWLENGSVEFPVNFDLDVISYPFESLGPSVDQNVGTVNLGSQVYSAQAYGAALSLYAQIGYKNWSPPGFGPMVRLGFLWSFSSNLLQNLHIQTPEF